MKVIIMASLFGSGIWDETLLKNNRVPNSEIDNQSLGSCVLGLQGAIDLRARKKSIGIEILKSECIRLINLSNGGDEAKGAGKHAYYCGLGYGAFTSSAIGKPKFAEMYAAGEIEKEMKKICL